MRRNPRRAPPQLVHQILGGSSDALGELYDMPAALSSYDHGSTCGFVKWLERSTVRLAAARANRIESRREVPLDSVPAPAARRVPTIDRLALEQALEGLTPALRTVFLLKAADGCSHREISAILGISVAASKVRLHRARKELRLILGDGMVGPRATAPGPAVEHESHAALE